jgi:alkylhydroperoxidase family enzyme
MTSPTEPRLPLVDEPTGAAIAVFDHFRSRNMPVPNLYRALANAPDLLQGWVDLAWPLRRTAANPRLRELAIVHLAHRRGSAYVATHHRRFAERHGATEEQLVAVERGTWRELPSLSPTDRLVLTLVDEVVDHGTAEAPTVGALIDDLGPRGTVEMLLTVAFYEAVCIMNVSLAIPLEDHAADETST